MVLLDIPVIAGIVTLVQQVLLVIMILFFAILFFLIEYLIFMAYARSIIYIRDNIIPLIRSIELIGKNLDEFKSFLQFSQFTERKKDKDSN